MSRFNLSVAASIAEIAASVGVLLSLIFVGTQIRDGNRETRAATIQAALDSEMFLAATAAEHAAIWDKVMTGQPLTAGEEMRTGIVLYNLLMTESENRFRQFNEGYLDARSWEGRRASLGLMVKLPVYEVWRGTPGGVNHSADFLALLSDLASDE